MRVYPPDVPAYLAHTKSQRTRAEADTRSPTRFLLWLVARQAPVLIVTALFGVAQFLPGLLGPWLVGRAIDAGVGQGDVREAARWAGWLLLSLVVGVAGGIAQHTGLVTGWLVSMYRTMLLVGRKAAQLGHVLPRRVPIGEALSVASSDSDTFGAMTDALARSLAALVAFLGMAWIVMGESRLLGLVTVLSAPIIVLMGSPLLRPLERSQALQRSRSSELTGQATDIVGGLRILRGVGGERTFGDNYAAQSQLTRRAGVRAGGWQAGVEALGVLLAGIQLVVLTWLGARQLLAGHLSVGQLVSFFGYAVFVAWPVATFFEFASKWVAALVSADRTVTMLRNEPPWPDRPGVSFPSNEVIVDAESGFEARPGVMTALVSAVPDESAAIADRLGRYLPAAPADSLGESEGELTGRARRDYRARRNHVMQERARADEQLAGGAWGVSVGGVDLSDIDLDELRRHVLVSDASAEVFAGTLQEAIDPFGSHTRVEAEAALRVAAAEDVYDGLAGGWQGILEERGRGLSGGQRQRLVLARALLADPEVLVLVEPTSAVDAHTEARIADRLGGHRTGRTTIVTTASPLVLRRADEVALLREGRVIARGTHHELMESCPDYRAVVVRDAQEVSR